MNRHLANYIFANETLYDVPLATEQVKGEVIKKTEKVENLPEEILAKTQENIFSPTSELMIVVNQMSIQEKEFLSKILTAIEFSIEKTDIVEVSKVQLLDYQSFISQFLPKKVLLFGVTFTKLNWGQMLQPQQTKTFGNIDFLLSDELSKIETNLELKKSLWANLQKLFPKKS